MGSRWKNKGQGGGVSWGNKEKKIGQQSKKKATPTVLSEAAAAAKKAGGGYQGQLAKGNLSAAQPTVDTSVLTKGGGLAKVTLDDSAAKKLWRVADGGDKSGPRILCLHGYTQNGGLLKRKLAGLEKHVLARCPHAVFTYPTGPHDAKEEWVAELDAEDAAAAAAAGVAARAWWVKTPSDGAAAAADVEKCEGWEESRKLLEQIRQQKGPFDAVVGFSQGAAAAALLAVAWDIPRCITAGGYVAHGHPLGPSLVRGEHPVRSLHAAGEQDELVTPTASQELASLFTDPVFFAHEGGHVVPNSEEFRDACMELLMQAPPSAGSSSSSGGGALGEARSARESRASELGRPMTPREATASGGSGRPMTPKARKKPAAAAGPSIPMLKEAEEDSEVADELEALEAIFMEEYVEEPELPHVGFSVRLNCEELEEVLTAPLYLSFQLPLEYPEVAALTQLRSRPLSDGSAGESLRMVLKPSVAKAVIAAVAEKAVENAGEAMVYEMVSAARECITEAAAEGLGEDEEDGEIDEPEPAVDGEGEEEEEETGPISRALALQLQTEAAVLGAGADSEGGSEGGIAPLSRKGGRWAWCIGLVGKPSAGKSTFFNAVAGSELAKVGATPFTTIDPNVHQATINVEGPVLEPGGCVVRCPVPVTVKDVAGLVPGACDGLGKGNRFLNDLCDADVLVHIIDASGKTDERGNANEVGGHEIVHDVAWIHNELQRWIFDNLLEKKAGWKRKPEHLYDMFTGYQAQHWLTHEALRLAGVVDGENLSETAVKEMTDETLSSVIDHFLAVRFPTVLAANKCDDGDAAANVKLLKECLGAIGSLGEAGVAAVVPLSARLECQLQKMAKEKKIDYTPLHTFSDSDGAAAQQPAGQQAAEPALVSVVAEKSELKAAEAATIDSAAAFGLMGGSQVGKGEDDDDDGEAGVCVGSTGVREVLACAMRLRPPVLVWPVVDLATGASYPILPEEPRSNVMVCRDVVVLKPGTTVLSLFEILLHPPWSLLGGEYIRCEGRPRGGGPTRQLKKDDILDDSNCVVRMKASRKGLRVKLNVGGGA